MIGFATALFAAMLAASSTTDDAIVNAVQAHYDSLLAGRVVSFRLDIRRVPQVSGPVQVLGVEGNAAEIPRGTQLCWVNALINGAPNRLPVTVRIIPQELAPVAVVEIPLYAAMNDSLISWRLMATDYLGSARIPTREQMARCRSRMKIARGTVITASRLEPIPDIRPGDRVTLAAGGADVEVRTIGRALQDGRIGEIVAAVNNDTGRRLRGVLEAGKIIRVK